MAMVLLQEIPRLLMLHETIKKELYKSMFCLGADAALVSRINYPFMQLIESAGDLPPELKGRTFQIKDMLPETTFKSRELHQVMFEYAHNREILHPVYSALQIDGYVGLPVVEDLKCLGLVEYIFLEKKPIESVVECTEHMISLARHVLQSQ